MSESAQIITAAAEACRRARLYGCKMELTIGGSRWGGPGPINLTITPDPTVTVTEGDVMPDDQPTTPAEIPFSVAERAARIPKRATPVKDNPQA